MSLIKEVLDCSEVGPKKWKERAFLNAEAWTLKKKSQVNSGRIKKDVSISQESI